MNEMMKTGNAVIDNYIELAKAASASGNNEQCELYCNKILEIESGNVAAWALKGHSAGWQSSLRAARVNEMLVCYGTAMQHAMSPELKLYLSNMANEDYMDVVRALLDLQCDRFRKWPDAEELGAISALCVKMLECGIGTLKPGGVQLQCMHTEQVDDFRKSLATKIGNCACETEAAVRSEYESSNNGYPLADAFTTLLDKEEYICRLYDVAICLAEHDDQGNIIRLKNKIAIHKYCINGKSYRSEYYEYLGWRYVIGTTLTQEAVNFRNSQIAEIQRKINTLQERIRQKKIREYWKAHADEKQSLENERKELNSEKSKLHDEQILIRRSESVQCVKQEIADLKNRRAAAGAFAFREKKNLQAQLADKKAAYEKMLSTQLDPIDQRLQEIDQRLKWIQTELERDR